MTTNRALPFAIGSVIITVILCLAACTGQSSSTSDSNNSAASSNKAPGTTPSAIPTGNDGDPVGHRQYAQTGQMQVTSIDATKGLEACIIQKTKCTWKIDFETTVPPSVAPTTVSCKAGENCFTVAGKMLSTDAIGSKPVYLTATVVVRKQR